MSNLFSCRSFKSLNSTGTSDGGGGASDTAPGGSADPTDPEEEVVLETYDNIFSQKSDQFQYRYVTHLGNFFSL